MTNAQLHQSLAPIGAIRRPKACVANWHLKKPCILPWQAPLPNDIQNGGPDLRDNGQVNDPPSLPFGNSRFAHAQKARKLNLGHPKHHRSDKSNRTHVANISFKDRLSTTDSSFDDLGIASAVAMGEAMSQSLFLDPVLGGQSVRTVQSDSFGQRLRRIRNLKGLTQEQLAENLNLTELQIGRWERDEALPMPKNLTKIAQFFQVPEIWLSYGGDSGPATVPVLGHVGAGAVVIPIEGEILEEIELPFSAPPDTRALRVRGDSMRPEISDGDFVVYRSISEDPHLLVGKLVIAKLEDGRVLVKRLRRGKDPNTFDLESTNAAPIENQRLVWCSRVKSVVFS